MSSNSNLLSNYKLCIAYDGTDYCGWQIQPHAPSIQQQLQKVACRILQYPVKIIGSSRTDAKVHAEGQVAHFFAPFLETKRFLHSLNALLPPSIRIVDIAPVPDHFHARYCAKSKEYHYRIGTAPTLSPFFHRYIWHLPFSLDLQNMARAAEYLVGKHDFSSFAHHASQGAARNNAIRTITHLGIDQPTKEEIVIVCKGNGFLHKMVRNIVGMLIEVGQDKRIPEEVQSVLQQKDRRLAAQTAPAHGLTLHAVNY